MNDLQPLTPRTTVPSPLYQAFQPDLLTQVEDWLRFFVSLDQFNRAIQGTNDEDQTLFREIG
ncbi:MAG: hypothetical protein KA314_14150 [Chloroflexi bacterium]|nr:hypothetical protein [Chloroflexota bacterium]MBP8056976.1 hypothetical protein [Chloroflexota bacterium]